MWAWIERVKGGLLLIGLALVALVSVFYRGRATGRQVERKERAEQINEQAANARKEVRDVEQETASMGDDAIADELKRDWVRGAGKSRH
ncbi:hypothetical protein [Achromobacter sp. UMC46]|uniref:hypothetical protein n=1 Tax=Achromobacter sp. UMC46 TaxID=1862319 RepID=UPI001601829D|nr:hypothetical protein [Achromobacter sp. UMC46]MBB1593608.1 hypothetical protein [Achromobacter sp. UMC46]